MLKRTPLFDELTRLSTEKINPRTRRIDTSSITGILKLINAEDKTVAFLVEDQIPSITNAVKIIVAAFRRGGRLFYVGAGTSGRLGVLDASECPPTYGTTPDMVQGLIAGGKDAVFQSIEGAEDNDANGVRVIRKHRIGKRDVVCGIAASIRTPFVLGAIREAKRRGARIVLITANPIRRVRDDELAKVISLVDISICADVGAEAIMGSTRMKAGTAHKLILNMLTTAAMIRLGKVYQNLMVDLKMQNHKLEERAKRIVMLATGVNYDLAALYLRRAGGHVKTAVVMIKAKVSASQARSVLRKSGGFVRKALAIARKC